MKINVKKMKMMCISRQGTPSRVGRKVKTMTKNAFMEKKKLPISKLNMDLNKRIVKSTISSVALYVAETWTMTETLRKKLEALKVGYGEEC